MRRTATALALLGFTACARAAGPSAEPAPAVSPPAVAAPATASGTRPPGAVRIPPRVASFAVKGRHDYEDRSLGTQLRYEAADSTIADVYLYPGPDLAADCPVACARTVMGNEVRSFENDFPEMVKRGYVQSIVVTDREELTPAADAAWQIGHHLTLAVTRDSLPQRSEFYLFYLPRYRVKIRATYVETPERLAAVRAFAAELVPALTRP